MPSLLPVLRRLVRPRYIGIVIVLAILVATGGMVYARRTTDTLQYRTATAALGTVTQTLSLSGNLAPLNEIDLDFGASGRVATVNVQPGQKVTAGTVLATQDPSLLQAALTQAQANLRSAQAKLSLDQAGPTAQSLSQAQSQVSSAQVGLSNARTSLTDTRLVNQQTLDAANAAVNNAQLAVNTDQGAVTADQQRYNADSGNSSAQSADQQKMTADQAQLSKDQATLSNAQGSLSATQVKVQQGNDQAQSQVATAQVQLQNAQASLNSLQQSITPQQIAQDQASVQVAQVNVDSAQRNLDQATITAPSAGTVGQVNLTVGLTSTGSSASTGASSAAASSSSTTHAIVLLTPGAFQVSGTVSDTQVNLVAVGQRARVTPAGSTEAATGKVTVVAAEATVTSGVATFGVTVQLDGLHPAYHAGVSASIQIIVNQVVGVLTVPTSAVSQGAVQVMVNGAPVRQAVTVGAQDASRTEIQSGLNAGDTVVIATVSSAIPTASSTNTRGAGGAGFGGALGGAGGGGAARGAGG